VDKTPAKSHNRTIDLGFVEHPPIAGATAAVRYGIKSTSEAWRDSLKIETTLKNLLKNYGNQKIQRRAEK